MNAKVAFDANVTGIRNNVPESRLGAAKQAAAIKAKAAATTTTKESTASKAAEAAKNDTSTSSSEKSNELGSDTFLNLLILQMQNQDPMDPMDNSAMLAQLAQFSALEQMTNLNESFETLSANVEQQNFMSASALVGKTILGTNSEGTTVNGKIDGVLFNEGTVYFTVGSEVVPMANVVQVV